jgi:hypothetical protein
VSLRLPALWFAVLAGCAEDGPDACARMCEMAAATYGTCLSEQGAAWTDAGYDDQDDFVASCDVWTFEMRLLEEDAVDRGSLEQTGAVDAACSNRRAALAQEGDSCDIFAEIDWATPPWRIP